MLLHVSSRLVHHQPIEIKKEVTILKYYPVKLKPNYTSLTTIENEQLRIINYQPSIINL
jgi:hypothetical protein